MRRPSLRTSFQSIRAELARRSRLSLVAGGVVAVLIGLGAGSADAYFTSHGSGTGSATTGSPVTITVTAASGTADLLPGSSGKTYFTLTNHNSLGASFTQVIAASVSSTSSGSCPGSNITFPSFPYTFSPAVTVGAGLGTLSGTQSIAGLVTLSSSAPNACQGVTFTVSLTLSGQTT
jgi:hypothetical protein